MKKRLATDKSDFICASSEGGEESGLEASGRGSVEELRPPSQICHFVPSFSSSFGFESVTGRESGREKNSGANPSSFVLDAKTASLDAGVGVPFGRFMTTDHPASGNIGIEGLGLDLMEEKREEKTCGVHGPAASRM